MADTINVLYLFRMNRARMLQEWRAGEGSSEFLYGLPYLDKDRFSTDFVESVEIPDWRKKLCKPVEIRIGRRVGIGFMFHMAWRNLKKLRRADVIVSTVDTCGLPVLMLKQMGLLRTPVIYISQGLAHRVEDYAARSFWGRRVRSRYRGFLRRAAKLLVLGEGAVQPLAEAFDLPAQDISVLPFGTDPDFWTPPVDGNAGSGGYVLSVGSDEGRDYPTLLKAHAGEDLRIVTRRDLPPDLLSDTIQVSTNHSQAELRDLVRGARLVAVPLRDIDQPSGQSATLQAMACGRPVILTRTKGLWEAEHMRHLETCYLVEPGDPKALREAIRHLTDNPDLAEAIGRRGRLLVEQRYNARNLAKNLEQHIENAL